MVSSRLTPTRPKNVGQVYASQVTVTLPIKFDLQRKSMKKLTEPTDRASALTNTREAEKEKKLERTTTYKQQVKARRVLVKHNILKKRETFNRPVKKDEKERDTSPSSLARFLRKMHKAAEVEASAVSMTRMP